MSTPQNRNIYRWPDPIPNQQHRHPSKFSKYEVEKIKQLISDTLILDLTDVVAGDYINRRSPVYVSYEYYKKHKTALRHNKNLLELIGNHKRVGYVAAYFDTINEIKFIKALVIRALYNGVNDNVDGKSIASLAMALDKLEQTYIVLNTGSPFMEMIVDELVKNNATNSNNIDVQDKSHSTNLILKKGDDGFTYDENNDIQRTIDRVLDRDGQTVGDASESKDDGGQVREDEQETRSNPPSSLILPEDDQSSGSANDSTDGSDNIGDSNSERRLSNGEVIDPTGVDTSEAIFK